MMQEPGSYQEYTHQEAEALFEIDFDSDEARRLDEENKQRIYQELMNLEW